MRYWLSAYPALHHTRAICIYLSRNIGSNELYEISSIYMFWHHCSSIIFLARPRKNSTSLCRDILIPRLYFWSLCLYVLSRLMLLLCILFQNLVLRVSFLGYEQLRIHKTMPQNHNLFLRGFLLPLIVTSYLHKSVIWYQQAASPRN